MMNHCRARIRILIGALLYAFVAVGAAPAQSPSEPFPRPGEALTRVFAQVVQTLTRHGLSLDTREARRAAVEAVVKTADPHGGLLTPSELEQMERRAEGRFYGFGLQLTMTNGQPQIVSIFDESPAAASALQPGDLLVQIGEQPIEESNLIQAQKLIRKEDKNPVTVLVRKANGTTNRVELSRAPLPYPAMALAEALPSELAYLQLNGLYEGHSGQVVDQLRDWHAEGRFGVVIDLRAANGSDVQAAAEIAELFAVPGSHLFSYRDHEGQDLAVYQAGSENPLAMPAMVLIDEQTTGAAEVLAAALNRSTRGAMLIGKETGRDPGIRQVIELDADGLLLYVATKRLVTADGHVYDGRQGVIPDVKQMSEKSLVGEYELDLTQRRTEPLEEELEDLRIRERVRGDATLRRAVDILLGLKALNIRGAYYSETSSN